MSLLFNMLSRFIVAFLPRSNRLLISWLQSPSAVILQTKKINSVTVSIISPYSCQKVMALDVWSLISECWVLSQLFHFLLSLSSKGCLVPLCSLLRSSKNTINNLNNLHWFLGDMVILTILILPIWKHGITFHLFLSSLISFISISQFLKFDCFVSFSQFSRSVMANSFRPHELQHARPPCLSPTPRIHPNSCPSSRWCHPAISSSVVPFSSCPQSLPASDSFPMSQLFSWGDQSTGVSVLASVLPVNG